MACGVRGKESDQEEGSNWLTVSRVARQLRGKKKKGSEVTSRFSKMKVLSDLELSGFSRMIHSLPGMALTCLTGFISQTGAGRCLAGK